MTPPLYRLDMFCPRCEYETGLIQHGYPHHPPRVRCGACLTERTEVVELKMIAAEQIDSDSEEALL